MREIFKVLHLFTIDKIPWDQAFLEIRRIYQLENPDESLPEEVIVLIEAIKHLKEESTGSEDHLFNTLFGSRC